VVFVDLLWCVNVAWFAYCHHSYLFYYSEKENYRSDEVSVMLKYYAKKV